MGIILVYDATEEQTFLNVRNWLKQIDQHASSNVAKVLVANKCDKPDKVIETERGKVLADEFGLSFFETSAKTGLNVAEVFRHIAQVIIREKMPAGAQPFTQGMAGRGKTTNGGKISLNETESGAQSSEGGCCK